MMAETKKHALIVAGGSGARMGTETPKQFLILAGKPLLMHTLEVFQQIPGINIVIVLPEEFILSWKQLCTGHSFSVEHKIVAGGSSRFLSVKNGLQEIPDGLVAIHDGVRPLVTKEMIERSFSVAAEKGNAVTVVKLKDSIREKINSTETRSVRRENFFLVQTPQTFKTSLIKSAYKMAVHSNFADDATVLEEIFNEKINLVTGDYRNFKITTPEDLVMAEALLKTKTDF
ncbi:MAG: 2-C-methyl-D-erythritol 4-phosphate cytidylyltransferase [Bacteroidia bacterium]